MFKDHHNLSSYYDYHYYHHLIHNLKFHLSYVIYDIYYGQVFHKSLLFQSHLKDVILFITLV